ncbi:MAG: rhomboid family intramembrane serine protease, partial [Planctomycetes bacterium]|nr:rhomboid family intramembrane serine protease [Planctomycetota bacterium]
LTAETLLSYGAIERFSIWHGEWWRLLSAVFLHVGWIHLLLNLFGIFPRCMDLEKSVGSAWFAFAYLTTGIGASAVSVIAQHAFGAGASGAGFGMFAATLSMLYRREGSWHNFLANPFARIIIRNLFIWVLIGLTMMGNIDHYAHLGGFLFGVPCGLLLENRRGKDRPVWMAGLAAYILVWAGVVAAACIPGLGFGDRG